MKNKKKLFFISGISLVVVVCIVLTVVFTSRHSKKTKPTAKDNSDISSNLVVDKPQQDKETEKIQALIDSNEKITDDGTGLKAQVEEEPVYKSSVKETGNKKTTKPAEKMAIPAEQGQSGIVIGSGENTGSYNCNTKNHHCDGPETHAFILNLELEGCPYCGLHACPSFYATDKWGHTCYTPSKCPKYNSHNDAAEYCQKCGKKCGDGGNGTCVQYIQSCNCPICGKWVESWTCHSH